MRRRDAFTLVELLVAIGVIAVMMAILLPTLGRARENANRLKCLSNLHQLGISLILYCQDNRGWLPRAAPVATTLLPESPQDYIWWQQTSPISNGPNRDVFRSPILKYLNVKPDVPGGPTKVDFSEERQRILRCPSDPLSDHPIAGNGNYYYSYSLNNLMQSLDPGIPGDGNYITFIQETGRPYHIAGKLVRVHNPSEKILFVEEASTTINDGSFDPGNGANLLSVRHDSTALNPPDSPGGFILAGTIWTVRNTKSRGNVVFCDGHADYVPRGYVNDPNYKITHELPNFDPFF
jgi:prepilin-type N-terminal cleavage/methylation domain-containing protein/prepilin-type processing-associated H-X9-DG protein